MAASSGSLILPVGATGDLSGNINRLVDCLRAVAYPLPVPAKKLREGDNAVLLPMLHYVLLDYSRHVSAFMHEQGFRFFGKDDRSFVDDVFRLLKETWGVPAAQLRINATQFLAPRGFVERKLLIVVETMKRCMRIHSEAERAHLASKAVFPYTRLTTVVPRSQQPDGLIESSSRRLQEAPKPEWQAKARRGSADPAGRRRGFSDDDEQRSLFPLAAHPYSQSTDSRRNSASNGLTHVGTMREGQIRSMPFLMTSGDGAHDGEYHRDGAAESESEDGSDAAPHPIRSAKEDLPTAEALQAVRAEAARELQAWEFLSDAVAIGSGAAASLFARKKQAILDKAVTAPLLARALDITPAIDAAVRSGFARPDLPLPPSEANGERESGIQSATVTVVAAGVPATRLSAPFLLPATSADAARDLRPVSYQQLLGAAAQPAESEGESDSHGQTEDDGAEAPGSHAGDSAANNSHATDSSEEPLAPTSSFVTSAAVPSALSSAAPPPQVPASAASHASSSHSHTDVAAASPSRLPIHRRYLNQQSSAKENVSGGAATADPAAASSSSLLQPATSGMALGLRRTPAENVGPVTAGIQPPGLARGIGSVADGHLSGGVTRKDHAHPVKSLFWPAASKAVNAVYTVPVPVAVPVAATNAARGATQARKKPSPGGRSGGVRTPSTAPPPVPNFSRSNVSAPTRQPAGHSSAQPTKAKTRQDTLPTANSTSTTDSSADSARSEETSQEQADRANESSNLQQPAHDGITGDRAHHDSAADTSGASSYTYSTQASSDNDNTNGADAVDNVSSNNDEGLASAANSATAEQAPPSFALHEASSFYALQQQEALVSALLAAAGPVQTAAKPAPSPREDTAAAAASQRVMVEAAAALSSRIAETEEKISRNLAALQQQQNQYQRGGAVTEGASLLSSYSFARASNNGGVGIDSADTESSSEASGPVSLRAGFRPPAASFSVSDPGSNKPPVAPVTSSQSFASRALLPSAAIAAGISSCGNSTTAYSDDFEEEAEQEEEDDDEGSDEEYAAALRRAAARRQGQVSVPTNTVQPVVSGASSSYLPSASRDHRQSAPTAETTTAPVDGLGSSTDDFLRQMLSRARQSELVIARAKEAVSSSVAFRSRASNVNW